MAGHISQEEVKRIKSKVKSQKDKWTDKQLEKAAALGYVRAFQSQCYNTMQLRDKEAGMCPNEGCTQTIFRCYICDTSCETLDCYSIHQCKHPETPTPTRAIMITEGKGTLCDHHIKLSKRSLECLGCHSMINICSCNTPLNNPCICGINRQASTQSCLCGISKPGIIKQSIHNCSGRVYNKMTQELVDNPHWTAIAFASYNKLAFIRERMSFTTKYIFKLQDRFTDFKTPEHDLGPTRNIWLLVKEHLPWDLVMDTTNAYTSAQDH